VLPSRVASHQSPPCVFCLIAGTLLGCLPNNWVAVNAGAHLSELQSLKDLYQPRLLLLGAGVGFAALLPVLLQRRAERKQAAAAAAVASAAPAAAADEPAGKEKAS